MKKLLAVMLACTLILATSVYAETTVTQLESGEQCLFQGKSQLSNKEVPDWILQHVCSTVTEYKGIYLTAIF